jgi:O-antigen/teichoic acid export membrane protein
MATTMANCLLGYAFWVIAARRYSASEIGAVTAIVSAVTIAATFADVGLRTTLMQELPHTRGSVAWSSRVSTALVLGTISATVAGCVAWISVSALSPQVRSLLRGPWPIGIVALTVAMTLSIMLDGVSTAEKRADQILVRNVVIASGKLVLLAVAAFLLGAPADAIFIAAALGTVVGVAYSVHWQLRVLNPKWSFAVADIGSSFRVMRGSLAGHYFINLGGWLPAFVIPLEVVALLGTEKNAYFTMTWLVGSVFFMVSPSVASALFVATRWDPHSQASLVRRSVKLIAMLLVPIALILVVGGYKLLSIFGSEYAKYGYPLLLVLIVSALPDAITNIRIAQLRARMKLQEAARLNSCMAAIAIGMAWILLPIMGIVGGGVAWLIAQICGSLWIGIRTLWARRAPRGAHSIGSHSR